MPLEICRRFYAEEIRVVANLDKGPLVEALAAVARENFLGAAPWRFNSAAPSKEGGYRVTSEVRDLYHDVFVALKSEKRLNNGQPSLIVGAIAKLQLAPGDRVLHVGCGSGYYTAVMAEVVGSSGSVLAVEVESELAAAAAVNLSAYGQVRVICADGSTFGVEERKYSGIFVNAAVTRPAAAWLSGLADGGRIVLPLSIGETMESAKALLVVVRRRGERFAADICSIFNIYASAALRDAAEQQTLKSSVDSKAIGRLRSLRVDSHEEERTCLAHGVGFCWSALEVDAEVIR